MTLLPAATTECGSATLLPHEGVAVECAAPVASFLCLTSSPRHALRLRLRFSRSVHPVPCGQPCTQPALPTILSPLGHPHTYLRTPGLPGGCCADCHQPATANISHSQLQSSEFCSKP